MTNIYNSYGAEEGSTWPKHKTQTGGESWTVSLGELLGNFIETLISMELCFLSDPDNAVQARVQGIGEYHFWKNLS